MTETGMSSTNQVDVVHFGDDESTGSYLQRIIDAGSNNILEHTSTSDICKEVILTLLQCAARLYDSVESKQVAIDLIQNNYTRALLRLGIQDTLFQAIHHRCNRSNRSDQSTRSNVRKYSSQVDLLSATQENWTQQLSSRVLVFGYISSMCRLYSTQLQNSFDSPGPYEQFMFYNYIKLSKGFEPCEKSWLVTLLPDLFRWEGPVLSSGTRSLAPRLDIVTQLDALTTSDRSHDEMPIRNTCDGQLKGGQALTDTYEVDYNIRDTSAANSHRLDVLNEQSYRRFGILEPMKRGGRYMLTIAEETIEQLKEQEELNET